MGQPDPPVYVIECAHCETVSTATVQGATEDRNEDHGPPALYQLLQCPGCAGVSLMVRENYGQGWDAPFRLWPAQRRPLSYAIPAALRDQHEEARKCYDAKAYTATVVMVRRTLEGVCVDKEVNQRTLVKSLEKLHADGFIDERLFEWAQALRTLGNEGAHFTGKQVPREDATEALDFCEALLDYIYVLKQKFEEFRTRRETKRSTEGS